MFYSSKVKQYMGIIFLLRWGSHYIAQADLKLVDPSHLSASDLPISWDCRCATTQLLQDL
jgi:hypothetical protein